MKLIDRYIVREVSLYVLMGIFGFAILIIGNNFYALSDLIFQRDAGYTFADLLMITLLDTPATMVLSLPVATLFGVILAIGRLSTDSEIVAMRTGGISLTRILIPLIVVSLFFSAMTYVLSEKVVPAASKTSNIIKQEKIKGQRYHLKSNLFFKREDDFILAVNRFNTRDNTLSRPVIYHRHDNDIVDIYTAHQGRFEDDYIVLHSANHFVYDMKTRRMEQVALKDVTRLDFPENLQTVHDDSADPSAAAIGDLSAQIRTLEQSGQDPSALRTNLAFKYSTPIACTIFSFVAFMFGVLNPRKERYSGVFMALVIIFIYYILQTIFKSMGEKGLISPPELSAWATNAIFIFVGVVAFIRTSK